MDNNVILHIYQLPQTVFSVKELSIIFPKINYQSLKDRLSYAVETNKLIHLRKGIYAKTNFKPYELANKIYTPSYISLETVLKNEGIIFQEYKSIFVVSYLTRKIIASNFEIYYRKIKNEILLNRQGIEEKDNYFIALKERAFLDAIFLYKNYHFDNLKPIDWKKVEELKKIYHSKILEKRVGEYYKIYKNEYV